MTDSTKARTSKAAVLSLVFGFSIIGSFVGLILGIVSFERIKKSKGSLKGEKLAIAGIVLGVIGTLVAFFVPISIVSHTFPPRTKKISDMKNLVLGCRTYAMDWDDTGWPKMDWEIGRFPEKLEDLYPDYIDDKSLLKAIDPKTREPVDYLYFSGQTDTSFSNSLLIATPFFIKTDRRVVGFCGGHVMEVSESQFQKMLQKMEEEKITEQEKTPSRN